MVGSCGKGCTDTIAAESQISTPEITAILRRSASHCCRESASSRLWLDRSEFLIPGAGCEWFSRAWLTCREMGPGTFIFSPRFLLSSTALLQFLFKFQISVQLVLQ